MLACIVGECAPGLKRGSFRRFLLKPLGPLLKAIGGPLYERYKSYAKKRDIRRTAQDRIGVLVTKIDGDVEDLHRRSSK